MGSRGIDINVIYTVNLAFCETLTFSYGHSSSRKHKKSTGYKRAFNLLEAVNANEASYWTDAEVAGCAHEPSPKLSMGAFSHEQEVQ